MNSFKIDERLKNDCHILGRFKTCYLLLMNNAHVPWFILLPKTDQTEYYLLDDDMQLAINQEINWVSEYIVMQYAPDKINVASIGNMVKQMHIHIVGRFENDYCWPGVVWGVEANNPYDEPALLAIKNSLKRSLDGLFEPFE